MKAFQKLIWNFYGAQRRTFPWRETQNPYFIFVSEVMLQQTQTFRVVPKYEAFLNTFPTVQTLANASFASVMEQWSGLGYNRRAKYLHDSARIIVDRNAGTVPQSVEALDDLPGVGYNTAAAVVVYSTNTPVVFIETNIRKVFLHHFFQNRTSHVDDKEILPLVHAAMSMDNPREWYWALMDYGTFLSKTIPNPNLKSAHYAKQSAFMGSVREVRGSILRTLIDGPKEMEDLKRVALGDKNHFDKALGGLLKERLVVQKGMQISLQ